MHDAIYYVMLSISISLEIRQYVGRTSKGQSDNKDIKYSFIGNSYDTMDSSSGEEGEEALPYTCLKIYSGEKKKFLPVQVE